MSGPGGVLRQRHPLVTAIGALMLAATIVVMTAAPASAPAVLLTESPQQGSVGSIAVINQKGDRVDIGAPHHDPKSDRSVEASLPHLGDGAYVVTWRVISADSHPVHGAFFFTVGHSSVNAEGLAAKLEGEGGGSQTVGVVFAIARAAIFAGIALLLGAATFAAAIRPHGRRRSRADALVWIGWALLFVSTVVAVMLQGPYAGALPLTKMFDVNVVRAVLHTRYGHIAEIRLALLLVLLPLLIRVRRSWRPPGWWWVLAVPLGFGIAATPGLAGHAFTGTFTQLAIPADTIHVVAMSSWLGGLAALALIMADHDPDSGRAAARFSPVALTSVTLIVASGVFASWRQVGFTVDAFTDTTYGRLLLVKVGTFIVLLGLAAWSRRVVRARRPASLSAMATTTTERAPTGTPPSDPEIRHLRWSVGGELLFAVAVLTITAMLVNAQPARSALSIPYSTEFREPTMSIDLIVAPAKAGPVDIHIYTLSPAGGNLYTPGVTAEMSLPSKGIAPITIPLIRGGLNHFLACNGPVSQSSVTSAVTCSKKFSIPFSGKWLIVIRALRDEFHEVPVQTTVDIR